MCYLRLRTVIFVCLQYYLTCACMLATYSARVSSYDLLLSIIIQAVLYMVYGWMHGIKTSSDHLSSIYKPCSIVHGWIKGANPCMQVTRSTQKTGTMYNVLPRCYPPPPPPLHVYSLRTAVLVCVYTHVASIEELYSRIKHVENSLTELVLAFFTDLGRFPDASDSARHLAV